MDLCFVQLYNIYEKIGDLPMQKKNQMALKTLFIWYIIHVQPFAAKTHKRKEA